MVTSRDQNAGQNGNIQIGNKSSETVEQFKYLGTNLMNQNSIHEEIKGRWIPGNACYHSVLNPLSPSLISKNVKIKIHGTIILPVVLNCCETWSLTLRQECVLTIFENRVLKDILGPKRDEVTGEWRRLHNVKLYALYSSPHFILAIKLRRIGWAGHVTCMGESSCASRVLVGKHERRRPLERPRRRWEDHIKMDFRRMG